MIKLKTLLLEREETDAAFRKEANIFFNKLSKFIKKSPEEIADLGKKKWAIMGGEIDRKHKSLMLVFSPVNSEKFAVAKSQGMIRIDLPILLPDGSLNYIDTSLKGHKDSFIHEFIHYLDELRYKGNKKGTSAQALQTKGEKGYYNTPEEFNAYYQEGANKIWDAAKKIKKKSDKEKERVFPKDYNQFLRKGTLNFFEKEFLYFMDSKYAKKFTKRIVDLYKKVLEFVYD